MTAETLFVACIFVATIGCGLIAGVFYAFSTFVMKALARRPAAEGMAAMQAINVAVINPLFLGVFLGTALLCGAAGVAAVARWDRPGAPYALAAAALYLLGTFLVTIAFNVPLNHALAAVAPTDAGAADHWARYVGLWTTWNHVRTAAAVAAMTCFILALRR